MPPPAKENSLKWNQEKIDMPQAKNVAMEIDCPRHAMQNTEAGPSERIPPSQSQTLIPERHIESVVYGDEFLMVEEELQYPYPRESLPIFLDGCGIKGPLFDRIIHQEKLAFFKTSPYDGPCTSPSSRF